MKKLLSILSLAVLFTSCTVEPLDQDFSQKATKTAQQKTINTFTVKWDSNQENAFVEFRKHVYITCKDVQTTTEIHREKEFTMTLENGQTFDMQIHHEAPKKNPELYLLIYKGDVLQYEKEINTNGFLMINYCGYQGNIGE